MCMTKSPLGLPRGSVRAITMLSMTVGFVFLHVAMLYAIIKNGLTDMAPFLGIVGSYAGVYGVIVAFYFRKDDGKTDESQNNQ